MNTQQACPHCGKPIERIADHFCDDAIGRGLRRLEDELITRGCAKREEGKLVMLPPRIPILYRVVA